MKSSLRVKTLFGIISVMAILIVIISIISDYLITKNVLDIETDYMTSRISQIRAVVKSDTNGMVSTLKDWSSWDETYNFINSKSPVYIKSNLENESINNIGIDVILFCDN
ncbi:MAG: CHASE4 domain-containing protein, partial [bacterium]